MGFLAFGTVLVLALIVGLAVQFFTQKPLRYEWLIIALAGGFGAYFASETIPGSAVPIIDSITNWGPELDGMLVVPAVVGGLVLALIAYIGVHTTDAMQPA